MPNSAKNLLQSVWEEAAPELARLVRAMGIDPNCADDVLQDVYLTAWRKPPANLGQIELKRWLIRVTTNRCNLEYRRRARWRNVFRVLCGPWSNSNHRSQPDAADLAEQRESIRSGLKRLEPTLRSVLVLRYFAEFDSKEIGRILELPDSTVRSRLRAARKRLAVELKQTGYRHE